MLYTSLPYMYVLHVPMHYITDLNISQLNADCILNAKDIIILRIQFFCPFAMDWEFHVGKSTIQDT